jgi:ABC-2 type transport system ATP-binding protein
MRPVALIDGLTYLSGARRRGGEAVMAMIEVDALSKRFRDVQAVDEVSFSVERGEVVGFLGPNGAGKSTTMKMITGFLEPSSGTARVEGFDVRVRRRDVQARIGYLPEGAPAYGDMSVGAFLEFVGRLRGLDGARRRERIGEMVHRLHLADVYGRRIETLSKGFKRRVGIAQALLHDPDVLILDEPTDGLDPNQKFEMRELIRAIAGEKAIVVSTHILEEVEAVCSRAIIIDRGTIVANGTPAELKRRSAQAGAITVRLGAGSGKAVAAKLDALSGVDHTAVLSESPVAVRAYPRKQTASDDLAKAISELATKEHWSLLELHTEEGRLDEVFRNITLPDTKASGKESK